MKLRSQTKNYYSLFACVCEFVITYASRRRTNYDDQLFVGFETMVGESYIKPAQLMCSGQLQGIVVRLHWKKFPLYTCPPAFHSLTFVIVVIEKETNFIQKIMEVLPVTNVEINNNNIKGKFIIKFVFNQLESRIKQ